MQNLSSLRSVAHPAAALENRLRSLAPLRPDDIAVVAACHTGQHATPPGGELRRGGAREPWRLLAMGWAAWIRVLPDGRRQVLQLLGPGDVLRGQTLPGTSVVAVSRVVSADASPLETALAAKEPRHAGLCLAWSCAEAAMERQLVDEIVRLGRLAAYERTAHLMLELMDRARRAGVSNGRVMTWPFTQELLSDVLGLSIVHVNRTLQQLRRDKLIELRAGQLAILDPERLADIAGVGEPS